MKLKYCKDCLYSGTYKDRCVCKCSKVENLPVSCIRKCPMGYKKEDFLLLDAPIKAEDFVEGLARKLLIAK